MDLSLGEIARAIAAEVHGDPDLRVRRVATLASARAGDLSFLANRRYRPQLRTTEATAVVLDREFLEDCPGAALVMTNPYLGYARAAALLNPVPATPGGVDPRAVLAANATVDPSAWIGPAAVIESGATVGPRAFVGPGCVVGEGASIGEDTRLLANVTLCRGVRVGRRVLLHPGVVIGADGFGIANDDGIWEKVPQLGSVRIGDDVEVGANTTIDRGALEDTVIEEGVKLDNLIQVGHNVRIGATSRPPPPCPTPSPSPACTPRECPCRRTAPGDAA